MVHNHPSGDPTPSKADITITDNVVNACGYLGLNLHDHLIIGKNEYVSLKELGYI
jgi:DNA repair protein RadC